jgi:hypothetical protein
MSTSSASRTIAGTSSNTAFSTIDFIARCGRVGGCGVAHRAGPASTRAQRRSGWVSRAGAAPHPQQRRGLGAAFSRFSRARQLREGGGRELSLRVRTGPAATANRKYTLQGQRAAGRKERHPFTTHLPTPPPPTKPKQQWPRYALCSAPGSPPPFPPACSCICAHTHLPMTVSLAWAHPSSPPRENDCASPTFRTSTSPPLPLPPRAQPELALYEDIAEDTGVVGTADAGRFVVWKWLGWLGLHVCERAWVAPHPHFSLGASCRPRRGHHVGVHTSSFRDFLLKPELLRAVVASGFENPSEGVCGGPVGTA